jgi:hypothetical protein
VSDTRDRRTLPLFPLPNVVLFPGVRTPLHIFEPRYRQMTAAALAGDRQIGMIAVRPEHTDDMAGDPPLFSVGCAGVIAESEPLADGGYNIVLHGLERFRILREPARDETRLYRTAEVELLDDPFEAHERPRVLELHARVIELFTGLIRLTAPERAGDVTPALFQGIEPATLSNTLCHLLDLPPLDKQGLLESHGVRERLERLAGALEFRAAELALHRGEGESTRH